MGDETQAVTGLIGLATTKVILDSPIFTKQKTYKDKKQKNKKMQFEW